MTHPAIGFISNIRRSWHDPRTPWAARWLLLAAAAYVLIPTDFIPDFVPVLGWLDDLAVVPAALYIFQRWAARRGA
jgi:uncharacterized membrane protein YkvA (DUF1232 family)